jgi:hypothetical protein
MWGTPELVKREGVASETTPEAMDWRIIEKWQWNGVK